MTGKSSEVSVIEKITDRIFVIRNERVMIDRDIAELYGVETKRLNEQVKRNRERFPDDFIFQLNESEKEELVAKCDRLRILKHSTAAPYAFTEHGAIMAATILNSIEAVNMSVFIVRAFVRMRELLSSHAEILKRLDELERKAGNHDKTIQQIIGVIKQLMASEEKTGRKIGF